MSAVGPVAGNVVPRFIRALAAGDSEDVFALADPQIEPRVPAAPAGVPRLISDVAVAVEFPLTSESVSGEVIYVDGGPD